MSSDVLILNRNFFAVHVASWQRAMTLLYRGHAHVIDEQFNSYDFDEWTELSKMIEDSPNGFVRTISLKIAIPEIIVLHYYDELPDSEVKFTRRNIYSHYSHQCCYCGKKFNSTELNLDHVIPKAQSGKTDWTNIVLSCVPCNVRKGNNTPQQVNLIMKYQPHKPAWRPTYAIYLKTGLNIKTSWKRFVDNMYWNSELKP